MRLALYARVSSDRQEQQETIASQVAALRAFAERTGAIIVPDGSSEVFADDGYSGDSLDRPAMTRLRALLATGAVDAVAVHEVDRLSRDEPDLYLLVYREMLGAGVELWIAKSGQQLADTDEGHLLFGVFTMFARLERRKIIERARRGGKHRAKVEGRKNGGIPSFGFDSLDGRYELNEEEVDRCHQMRRWLLDGVTPGLIAQKLMAEGVPTKYDTLGIIRRGSTRARATWYPDQVRRILSDRLYCGELVHRAWDGEEIIIPVPAIFTTDQMDEHRRIIERNRSVRLRADGEVNVLRGLVVCGECDRRYIAGYGGKKPHRQRIYRCGVWHHPAALRNCGNKSWTAKKLERIVWERVASLIADPALVMAGLKAKGLDSDRPELRINLLRKRLGELDAEDKRVRDAYKAGSPLFTLEQSNAAFAESTRARSLLTVELGELTDRMQQGERARDLEASLARFRDRLPQATAEQRAAILREIVERITVTGAEVEIEVVLPAAPEKGIGQSVPRDQVVVLGPLRCPAAAELVGRHHEVGDRLAGRQRPQLRIPGQPADEHYLVHSDLLLPRRAAAHRARRPPSSGGYGPGPYRRLTSRLPVRRRSRPLCQPICLAAGQAGGTEQLDHRALPEAGRLRGPHQPVDVEVARGARGRLDQPTDDQRELTAGLPQAGCHHGRPPAQDLLVALRQLPADGHVRIGHQRVQVTQQGHDSAWRLVQHQWHPEAPSGGQMPLQGPTVGGDGSRRQEAAEQEAGSLDPGKRQGGRDGRGAGNRLDPVPRRPCGRHQLGARVADGGHAGVGGERQRRAVGQPREQPGKSGRRVVVVERERGRPSPKVGEQPRRKPRVLGHHQVGAAQRLARTRREVAQIPDRGADHQQAAADPATRRPGRRHRVPGSRREPGRRRG